MPAGMVATKLLGGILWWGGLCSRQEYSVLTFKQVPSGTTQSLVAVGAFLCSPISPEFHFWVEMARICVCRAVGGWGAVTPRCSEGSGVISRARCGTGGSGRMLMWSINPAETGEVRAGRQEQ